VDVCRRERRAKLQEYEDERKKLKPPTPQQLRDAEERGPAKQKAMHSEFSLYKGWLFLVLMLCVLGFICYMVWPYLPNG